MAQTADGNPRNLEAPSSSTNATYNSTTTEVPSNPIDSALLCALRDARERVSLLRLEDVMVQLVRGKDPYWDMGGPNHSLLFKPLSTSEGAAYYVYPPTTAVPSSFQRCVLHRLADRFGLAREHNRTTVESTPPPPAGWMRLYRTPETQVPSVLLIDLEPHQYQDTTAADASNTPATEKSKKSSSKKKILIKRNSSSSLGQNNNKLGSRSSSHNSSSDLTDKERLYAEARARIFNEGQERSSSSSLGAAAAAEPSSSDHTFAPPEAALADATSQLSLSSSNPTTTTPAPPEQKVTWRNRRQEAYDPDFQRGRGTPMYPAYQYNYPPPPTTSNTVATISSLPATSFGAAPFVPGSGAYRYAPPQAPPPSVDNPKDFPAL